MNALSMPTAKDEMRHLLTQVAGRVDGAVDFWTVVCLGNVPVSRHDFVVKHSDELRAIVAEIARRVKSAGLGEDPRAAEALRALAADGDKLRAAFVDFARFRDLPLPTVRSATEIIGEVYRDVRTRIPTLAQVLGVPIEYWDGRRGERESYYRDILNGLYAMCLHEREKGVVAAPAGGGDGR